MTLTARFCNLFILFLTGEHRIGPQIPKDIAMTKSFESVYEDHYEKLYTLAFRMTGSKEESEDILQTSFLSAYKAFKNFRHDSTVYTWLYRIVLNTSKKFFKERKRLPVEEYCEEHNISQAELYDYINNFGRTENDVLTNQTRESCLQMFVNCMPSKYRAVYTLRVVLSFSVKDTAEILGISENAVKVNLTRGRTIIKSHFTGRCSLIKPGAICDCRSFAKFLSDSGRTHVLLDMETVRDKERTSVEEFTREMREIFKIDGLYQTKIKPTHYYEFIKRIKRTIKEKDLKMMQY